MYLQSTMIKQAASTDSSTSSQNRVGTSDRQKKKSVNTEGDNITVAISAVLLSVFALSLGNATIKQVSVDFTLWQIFFVRSALAIPVLLVFIKFCHKDVPIKLRLEIWPFLRTFMLSFMWVTYYTALPHVDLSIAAGGYYTLPIFITLFAALFIGDDVGVVGWTAVILGFCGVLLILGPQAEDLNVYVLLPIVSAILFALAMIITRTKCRKDNALILSLELNVSFIIFGVLGTLLVELWAPTDAEAARNLFLFGQWSAMEATDWFVMALLAVAATVGSVAAAIAYQRGPSAIVATFDFAYVGFAVVWGFLFFSEVPNTITVTGIVLIVGAGLLSMRRLTTTVEVGT